MSDALRESVYHFFYAESGYSYNARYLDKSSLFWGMAKITLRPLSLHISKHAFLVKWLADAARDANNHSNKADGKDLCIHRSIYLVGRICVWIVRLLVKSMKLGRSVQLHVPNKCGYGAIAKYYGLSRYFRCPK